MRQLILVLFTAFLSPAIVNAQTPVKAASVSVSGEVTKALKITLDDLAKMKHDTVSLTGKDGKAQVFSGVAVKEILRLAGVTIGPDLKGENLAKYLLVKCADGYQVIFSLAELDESFTDRKVILADQADGKPLPSDRGPFRLAVPGEKKPARSCHQVTDFIIGYAR